MSGTDRIVEWNAVKYRFDLGHPWVRRQIAFRGFPGENGSSPAACLARFESQAYTEQDVVEIIRLGLIGGGSLHEVEINRLISTHVLGKPLAPLAIMAFEILAALFVGNEPVAIGEAA